MLIKMKIDYSKLFRGLAAGEMSAQIILANPAG
jgi:hypothetical protein